MNEKRFKTPLDSNSYMAEIIGEESLMGQRMSAGKLLHMMDLAAASAAAKHAESFLVTLAFDRIELLDFICHRDYVRYDASVIEVGRSSMVVKLDCYFKAPTEMDIQKGHSGFITFVALTEDRKPNRNIPGLLYKTKEELLLKKIAEKRASLEKEGKEEIVKINSVKQILQSDLKDYYDRSICYKPEKTEITIRKKFLPRNANSLGIVFGGDTIEMMEELALAAARQFTGNFRMVTIAMEDILFLKPIKLDYIVEMRAEVIFVASTTLVVEITVTGSDFLGINESYVTNKGKFTVLNYDRSGNKKRVTNGLDLTDSTLETKKSYLIEQMKYEKRTGLI